MIDRNWPLFLAIALLPSGPLGAQSTPPAPGAIVAPLPVRTRPARDAAPATAGGRVPGVWCYATTDGVTFPSSVEPGETVVDWDELDCAGLSPIVSAFSFGYATRVPDPALGGPGASLTLTFYTGYQGFAQDSGRCPVATFAFSGLPGTSGSSSGLPSTHLVSVDASAGLAFCLPDGRFAMGLASGDVDAAGAGATGPLLVPEDPGRNSGLDFWYPDTKGVGSYLVCQAGPCVAFWLAVERADLSAFPAAVAGRNLGGTNAPDSLSASGAVLGTVLELALIGAPGHAAGLFFAFDTPAALPLAGGQVLGCVDGGGGELLTGAGLAGTAGSPVGGLPTWSASVPVLKDLSLAGATLCLQGLSAFGATPFALSSAVDVTLGG